MKTSQDLSFLQYHAVEVAPRLLGCTLERTIGDKILRARIVETEAYDQTDVASHSYRGETERTRVMFGPAGFLYVYFTYGMHHCCNVVVGEKGYGAAVLIRALEPMEGVETMARNRGGKRQSDLTNGPGKLCQALDITRLLNGHDLHVAPLRLIPAAALAPKQIVQTTRIGISQATDMPWRFYIQDSAFVSKP